MERTLFLVVLVSDRNQGLKLQSYWGERRPQLGRKMTILGEDMTVDEPGRVGAVLSAKTRDFVLKHWNTEAITNIFELVSACGEAKNKNM